MLKRHPFLVSVIVLLVASLACTQSTTVAPPDPNALNTSIAQTVSARQTEAALNNPATVTFTFAPELPTLTLEPTLSVTPDFTPTLETPLITVDVDTNCRTGPGAEFERVGILLVGETAEIIGREPTGKYWYIRNPDETEGGMEYCWVWGEYATVTGNILPLLFLSPPPPPVADFNVTFTALDRCDSNWWVDFKLDNLGSVLLQSISIVLTDIDTVTLNALATNDFENRDGCGSPRKTDSLVGGGSVTVSSPTLPYNPTGHNLNAKITVCPNADLQGACLTQDITFKP